MFYLLTLKDPSEVRQDFRVVDWHARQGDICNAGMLLIELESNKSVLKIQSSCDVYLRKVLVGVDHVQSVGKPLAVFSDSAHAPMPPSFAGLPELAVVYLS